ncbi:hypothetical protein [Paenibacillus hubeiensis]|uniref:hypothetical protein n=1 Tax=Paenibacillus hubeiensis TaxID=3077330 RepID=UPI0031BB4957
MNNIEQYINQRFSSAEEYEFLNTEQYRYFIGNEPGMDEPVQIRADVHKNIVEYRNPTHDKWVLDPEFKLSEIIQNDDHRNVMQAIADELKAIFIQHDLWYDATIYFNQQAYVSGEEEVYEYVDPTDYAPLANTETVTVTYEGRLNTAINQGQYNPDTGETDWTLICDIQDMLHQYGYYMSVTDHISFVIYPI